VTTEPELEKWKFKWYEDLFAEQAKNSTIVNVAAKAYRRVALYEPGEYQATLTYFNGTKTVANWFVKPLAEQKKAKNVILFIGDGMTTNMITAARLLGHKTVNGKYQSKMALDKFPVIGHQMTHSLDTYITDSANSASALYSGHKSSVNAMGVYGDSSPDPFDDPKVETIVEILTRIWKSAIGVVSTAYLADATPIALTGHTRLRSQYGPLVDQMLNGVSNYSWTEWNGPDVLFGGGAEYFLPGKDSFEGQDYVDLFKQKGYQYTSNATSLAALPNTEKALGLFCTDNLPVWLDRNVFTDNIKNAKNSPTGDESAATDLPGLKEMTVKAVEILHTRGGEQGFFLMSEAASIDKQMHSLDYDRALGDLLELDDTVKATIEKLTELGVLEETLILVTADHGHGFDVYGSHDTQYAAAQTDERERRNAVGTYAKSGQSQYLSGTSPGVTYDTGAHFPTNWSPRYVLAQGTVAFPDKLESFVVHEEPRVPAVKLNKNGTEYFANAEIDGVASFGVNGTIPPAESQGVHSLTDVPVYAKGPCQELFQGTYSNVDVFFAMAECLGLGRPVDAPGDLAKNGVNGGGAGGNGTAVFTGAASAKEILNGGGVGMAVAIMGAAWVGAWSLL
jgi:alkaline phosphatase